MNTEALCLCDSPLEPLLHSAHVLCAFETCNTYTAGLQLRDNVLKCLIHEQGNLPGVVVQRVVKTVLFRAFGTSQPAGTMRRLVTAAFMQSADVRQTPADSLLTMSCYFARAASTCPCRKFSSSVYMPDGSPVVCPASLRCLRKVAQTDLVICIPDAAAPGASMLNND
jgi:hypothetical protein